MKDKMKTLLITLLLSISIFGQTGGGSRKSVLTQAQKDSIGGIVADSLEGYKNAPYFLSLVNVSVTKTVPFDFLTRAITVDSLQASTDDSSFAFNLFYGTGLVSGGTALFDPYEIITADETITINEVIPQDNYFRITIIPDGSEGEVYAIKIFYH